MTRRRVVITGLGVVTALGAGAQEWWTGLTQGRTGIGPIAGFDASGFPSRVGGEIGADFSARNYVPKSYRKSVKVMARDIEIAVAAADLAFRDAGLRTRGTSDNGEMDMPPRRLGCNIGAGLICADLDELAAAVNHAVVDGRFDLQAWGRTGLDALTPLWLLKYLPNMLSCHATIIHGCEGPSNCITCGDVSGHLAAGEAVRHIEHGRADVVIAGGAESKLNPMGLLRQCLLGRACTTANDAPVDACRPFDARHSGTVVGEGGALLIFEELEHARARGARIYAEVIGCAAACDPAGVDITRSGVGSLQLAAAKALNDAGLAPGDVHGLIAHGTGVAGEDDAERSAWEAALGERAEALPAAAVTGACGSLYAGAGAVELATAALALHHQALPPTVGFARAAREGVLQFSGEGRSGELDCVLTGGFSVGGQSAAAVLRRYQS